MRSPRRRLVLALLALLAPASGAAQQRPVLLPTRDVDVTYRSGPPGHAIEQRARFAAPEQRMRLDAPTPGLFVVVDYRSNTMLLVSEGDRKVMELPAPPGLVPGVGMPEASAPKAERQGSDSVAGLACTEWKVADMQGVPVLLCLTDDGVMLRVRQGTRVLAIATKVSFAPLDRALFQAPAGFTRETGRGKP